MDTDLAEKTVSSSTLLSGGDEVCECVCVCALVVCAYSMYVYSFHTRMHAYKSVAQGSCTLAVLVPTHVSEAEWLQSPSLRAYMHIYMTDSGTDRCTAVSSTVQVSVVCHMCIVCTHVAAVFV